MERQLTVLGRVVAECATVLMELRIERKFILKSAAICGSAFLFALQLVLLLVPPFVLLLVLQLEAILELLGLLLVVVQVLPPFPRPSVVMLVLLFVLLNAQILAPA